MVTRYLGFCPVCRRDIKLAGGVLVHHGYKRPGIGYIVGDCFGVGRTPHEVSPETAEAWRAQLGIIRERNRRHRSWLDTARELKIEERIPYAQRTSEKQKYEMVTITPDDPRWRESLRARIAANESELRMIDLDIMQIENLIRTWEPRPLRTVEEEEAGRRTQATEREQARATKRDQKVAEQIEKFQKRIDSAIRNKNLNPLLDIYESAPRKLKEVSGWFLKISDDEARALLDRDAIWRALGLLTEAGYEDPGRHREFPSYEERTAVERASRFFKLKYLSWKEVFPEGYHPNLGFEGTPEDAYAPNAGYYVWLLDGRSEPLSSEGPFGPHAFDTAKSLARIGATEGKHDRAVSLGRDPKSPSFRIVRGYRAGTGERLI